MNSKPTKIICVGRNYADHAKELGNEVPKQPLIFIKPPSSVNDSKVIHINEATQNSALGSLHYECELSIKIKSPLKKATEAEVLDALGEVTLGLDLTLRELQTELKTKGHPWERAKAFDNACVFGEWLNIAELTDLAQIHYSLSINDEVCQTGKTELMLFPIVPLIADISQQFTLQTGDIVMTGTPKGVGQLNQGDKLTMTLQTKTKDVSWQIVVE